jgi:drug/metabolite transporter (DMT)-like permease
MTIAMAFFIANDAIVKYVSQSLGAAQLIFIRGLFGSVLLLAVARHLGALGGPRGHSGQARQLLNRPLLARAAIDAVATMVYLTALFHLPIGNATAINLATPLFITLFAVLTLGERVGAARWLTIGTGFLGVLLVVQPRAEGFNAWALLCVAGTLLHAARDTLTRAIPSSVPSILITVSTAVSVAALSGVLSIPQGWKPMDMQHLALLAVAAAFLAVGYYLLINAMREGEMSVVAPFRYTGLLYALAIGYLVWGEVPNALAWAGIALLVGAGLVMLQTERARSRAALEAAAD